LRDQGRERAKRRKAQNWKSSASGRNSGIGSNSLEVVWRIVKGNTAVTLAMRVTALEGLSRIS
jgi:hypothetical protein